ncbi:MAG: DUF1566 domain-containing protein [Pseudomonadota bacterium]
MQTGIYSVLIFVILSLSSTTYAQEIDTDLTADDTTEMDQSATSVDETTDTIKSQVHQKCYTQLENTQKLHSFSVCNNGNSIYDNLTGLMWSRCTIGKMWNSETKECEGDASIHNWKESLNEVHNLNQTGFLSQQDWRLPNIKELASIVDLSCVSPAIDQTVFPDTDNAEFWTSSVFEQYPGRAWYLHFGLGHDYPADKRYFKQLRLVRLGMGASSYNLVTDSTSSLEDACISFATIKFASLTDVPLSSTIKSEQVIVSFTGNNDTRPIHIENGEYEINENGIWSSSAGTIKSGDTVSVRHLSSDKYLDDVVTTLYVGDTSAIFKSTTMQAVVTPYEDVMLDAEILFAYKSSELSAEAKTSIDGYMDQYRDKFNQIAEIIIIGHTDGIASQKYNQELSEQRARSVADYVESIEGTPDTNIEAVGKGKLEPIASNDTEEGRAKNRRVVMRFVFK